MRYLVYVRGKMTGLINCLVLSCFVSVIFAFTSVRDDANWFKNGQRIKNRFVTGVVNGIVDFHCNNTVNGDNVEGECLSKVECTKSGGKAGGLCSLLGSCCVIEKTCSQTTSSKISYFVSPKNLETNCPLTVNIYSKDVCQIRLDFDKFEIEQPTNHEIKLAEDITAYSSYQCHNDSFTVENSKKNLGFRHLCGRNTGQHIYVPIVENQKQVVLRFKLQDRNETNSKLIQPQWKIKIRQLECRKSGYEHLLNAPSKLMTMYNNLKNKKQTKTDWELIAPFYCLQYHPQMTGTFESFNYNEGRGPYIGEMDYAICFRKKEDVCGAEYTAAGIFQMNFNDPIDNDNRCHPKKEAGPTLSQDYIQISRGKNSDNQLQDYYCDMDLKKDGSVIAKSREPLYVGVHTDKYRANKKSTPEEDAKFQEIGFKIKYTLLPGDC